MSRVVSEPPGGDTAAHPELSRQSCLDGLVLRPQVSGEVGWGVARGTGARENCPQRPACSDQRGDTAVPDPRAQTPGARPPSVPPGRGPSSATASPQAPRWCRAAGLRTAPPARPRGRARPPTLQAQGSPGSRAGACEPGGRPGAQRPAGPRTTPPSPARPHRPLSPGPGGRPRPARWSAAWSTHPAPVPSRRAAAGLHPAKGKVCRRPRGWALGGGRGPFSALAASDLSRASLSLRQAPFPLAPSGPPAPPASTRVTSTPARTGFWPRQQQPWEECGLEEGVVRGPFIPTGCARTENAQLYPTCR